MGRGKYRPAEVCEEYLCLRFRDCTAGFLEIGKAPEIWEIAALLRLDGLNSAAAVFQEDAFLIGLIQQGETLAIPAEASVLLDEIKRGQPEE